VRVYLVSRVAFDAHQVNLKVANALRQAGHSVFLPHEASYNQDDNRDSTDEDVYRQDMAEMLVADAAVIVGRIGVDCAFEVGWFQAYGTPAVWYVPPSAKVGRHPMLNAVPRSGSLKGVLRYLSQVEESRGAARKMAGK
jgi:nucleoside 2-deoxyribosyltransferase